MQAGIKKRQAEQDLPLEEQPALKQAVVNPYGSGTGMPVIKSEMMLPMAMAPRVVAAEILKELERECNVIIKLDQDNATAKGSPKKQVACDRVATINGTGPDVAFCKYRIFELMMGQPPPVSMFAPKDAEGNKSMQILIPAIRVGLVIGRGGETIKYLQETTGCRVSMTPETAADSNHQTRAVTVSGSEAAIQHAKKLIEDITGGPVEFQEGDAYVTEIIKVPNDRVGLIIGKGGETIKMIQKECNVKLNIEQQPDDNLERALSITGTKENVQFATEAVYERVAGVNLVSNLAAW